jgi:hypothetical protein
MCLVVKASHRLNEPEVDRPALICCHNGRDVRRCRRMMQIVLASPFLGALARYRAAYLSPLSSSHNAHVEQPV